MVQIALVGAAGLPDDEHVLPRMRFAKSLGVRIGS